MCPCLCPASRSHLRSLGRGPAPFRATSDRLRLSRGFALMLALLPASSTLRNTSDYTRPTQIIQNDLCISRPTPLITPAKSWNGGARGWARGHWGCSWATHKLCPSSLSEGFVPRLALLTHIKWQNDSNTKGHVQMYLLEKEKGVLSLSCVSFSEGKSSFARGPRTDSPSHSIIWDGSPAHYQSSF